MKKLALASAISAVTLATTGAHAVVRTTTANIVVHPGTIDITADCATQTPAGGMSGVIYDDAAGTGGISGTVCMTLDSVLGPWVMLGISLQSDTNGPTPGGTLMDGGALQIAVDTAGFGWVHFSTISVPTNNINCSGLTSAPAYPLMACYATLFSVPADLWIN